MPWNVVQYQDDMLPDLVGVYNDAATRLPYHWPVSVAEFLEVGWGLCPEEILVAFEGGRAIGFIHLESPYAPQSASGGAPAFGTGTVRALFTRQKCEVVAGALLQAAAVRLARLGAQQILAWPRTGGYPFYNMNRGGCWSGLDLHQYFLSAGYQELDDSGQEGLFATTLPKVRVISLPGRPIRFEYLVETERVGPGRGVRMHKHMAWVRDEAVGECWWHGLDQLQHHSEARRVSYIARLKAAPAFQSISLAKTLILQAFQAMAGRGVRAVVVHCRKDGPEAAGRLLESLGFVFLGESFRYIKSI